MSTASTGYRMAEVTIEGGYTAPLYPVLVVQKNEQNEREQKSIVFC